MLRAKPKHYVDALILAKENGLFESDSSLTKKAVLTNLSKGGDPIAVIEQIRENKRLNQMPQTFGELSAQQLAEK